MNATALLNLQRAIYNNRKPLVSQNSAMSQMPKSAGNSMAAPTQGLASKRFTWHANTLE
jgi:hypothetical protein